ncbi:type II secretion system F family protein [Georgenia faecalis]|uniref:type II secretion system F family protein n=1 Tax=Georgenia faecalis TaxID=2483799 RepID=UPI000FD92891|nr:type II secretion system F family protein [Georgenia faecalis]
MNPLVLGALAGLSGGLGLWLVVVRIRATRPRLIDRVAPYLRERPRTSTLLAEPSASTPFATVEHLLGPVLTDAARVLERLGSTSVSIRRRLQLSGTAMTLEEFRLEQVVWSAVGLAGGLLGALVLGASGGIALLPSLALALIGAVLGAVGRDQVLSHRVTTRQRRLLTQLPAVAELLALAVGAGEGPAGAMERVSRTTRGELTAEIDRVLAESRSGVPLALALERMAGRTTQPAVARFAEGVAVAVERGTPLAEVLRSQARDAREAARRELMETGGKKEIAMMVPVVFLVLPVTVLFALFPGLAVLRVGL